MVHDDLLARPPRHRAGHPGPEGPEAEVETADGARQVTARKAEGEERERLWARWQEIDGDLDAYEARRGQETAVVVLEPRG